MVVASVAVSLHQLNIYKQQAGKKLNYDNTTFSKTQKMIP